LSSELSVFTLAVITLERNYAITHAMHLNKRLSLRHAAYIMVAGWTYALLTASMPLIGVSDYRKFAICLPFETGWETLPSCNQPI
jgi:leucine-rich repeat-containing G protein-coupled receptor 6